MLANTIKLLYAKDISAVDLQGFVGDRLKTTMSKSWLSPVTHAFSYLERTMSDAFENIFGTVNTGRHNITTLRFKDDIGWLARRKYELATFTINLNKLFSRFGMELSAERKTNCKCRQTHLKQD